MSNNTVEDFGIVPSASNEELYNAIKRFNPNFSLKNEYQEIMRRRSESKDNITNVMYNLLKDIRYMITNDEEEIDGLPHHYCTIFTDNDESVRYIRDALEPFVGNPEVYCEHDMQLTYTVDDDHPLVELFKYMKIVERGPIYHSLFDGWNFVLSTPEIIYHDSYSEDLIRDMEKDGILLYDIAIEQQYKYMLTKNIPKELKDYIDSNRQHITDVQYDINNTIVIVPPEGDEYRIKSSFDVFKGVVAYLHHPSNIVEENTEEELSYRYYNLEDLK